MEAPRGAAAPGQGPEARKEAAAVRLILSEAATGAQLWPVVVHDITCAFLHASMEGDRELQQTRALEMERMELSALASYKDELRQQRLYKTRREHDFLHDWQEQGIEEWMHNQEIQRNRELMVERFHALPWWVQLGRAAH